MRASYKSESFEQLSLENLRFLIMNSSELEADFHGQVDRDQRLWCTPISELWLQTSTPGVNSISMIQNVIYEGTPHGKAELAYFYFHFLLVLNLIYFVVEYVELYI